MNDETPEDQTTDFAQSEQEYKSITQEEFDRLYEKHHNWLEASKQIKDTQLESANNVLKPDFSYHDLRDIDLKDKNLQKANLKNCNFEGSTLKETNLSEALLHNSNFTNTKFQNTDLFQAQFHDAILTNADFSGETIPNALFFRANLKHSNFTNSYLEDCQFDDADLTNAVLTNAILTRTIENLSSPGKAKFENANFKNSNLNNATLSSSDLTNANFQNSTMVRVKLENTNTAGTHFGGADITNALFPRADYFDDRLKTLEEASKNARTIFITLLTVIAYSGLAVLSTKDFDLLIESSNFKLPLIPSSISVDLFYFLAPTLIFGLFFICLYTSCIFFAYLRKYQQFLKTACHLEKRYTHGC
ncbi:hypothetical protein NITGR_130030 [Nitrospina gracilis 3/211]|uniref:Pentapeptide repeat protein n=1 Tax=Nitrospina gracilis (strain 3/211) TaxID=1266370 RepID=M1YW88_NITG3|nr:pentapeptide repeat-containing protein [Nitrospina gracilis]CCQ89564.1 hypothetical protein NITGR_130030 [Nitrospina gracilis 3/211]